MNYTGEILKYALQAFRGTTGITADVVAMPAGYVDAEIRLGDTPPLIAAIKVRGVDFHIVSFLSVNIAKNQRVLRKFFDQVFRFQMCIPFQHGQVFMPGDCRHFHNI